LSSLQLGEGGTADGQQQQHGDGYDPSPKIGALHVQKTSRVVVVEPTARGRGGFMEKDLRNAGVMR
jgi:hypothetical protein